MLVIATSAIEGAASERQFRSLLAEKCLDCHSGDDAEAGLQLDALASELPWVRNRDTWQRVVQLVEMQSMPPEDVIDISDAERRSITKYVQGRLDNFDYSGIVDPGHEPIRRLTHRDMKTHSTICWVPTSRSWTAFRVNCWQHRF